ncbi:MAG: hypothetical protein A2Z96_02425 [Spirochaetes bacterium GWB1_48_6]|nr:MAG: hypothetical protein A2Z96_02425 [Spirochaetes bacterium GWB1_48_6]
MRKILSLLPLLIIFTVSIISADEKNAVWERIYKNSFSDEQRFAVMLNILELKDRAFIPMLQESLGQLSVRNIEMGTSDEIRQKTSLAKLIVKELGNLRALEAAEEIFRVYSETKDPFLKGEAALALGKIRAVEYLPFLVRQLEALNLEPNRADPRSGEIVAYSLVQSLEIMRSPLGYEPVFLASLGWYSPRSQVKEIAKGAIKVMVDDPSEALTKILTTNPDLKIKIKAVEALGESKAPLESKAVLARKTLEMGMQIKAKNKLEEVDLLNIRTLAMKLLIQSGDRSPETVPLLKGIINLGMDENEVITALSLLGVNASDTATTYLSDLLASFNEKQRNGTNKEKENRIIRQIISSLGVTKNPIAKPALLEMQYSNYTPATVREANGALKEIP